MDFGIDVATNKYLVVVKLICTENLVHIFFLDLFAGLYIILNAIMPHEKYYKYLVRLKLKSIMKAGCTLVYYIIFIMSLFK